MARSLVDKPPVVVDADRPVALCFTDIEDSTPVLERLPNEYPELIALHHRFLREAFAYYSGTELNTEGDGFFVSFTEVKAAVRAAVRAQLAFARYEWPSGGSIRVRIGVHVGSPVWTSEGFVGLDVNRAARVKSAAHGGQILISAGAYEAVRTELAGEVDFSDLGVHRLKGLAQPERLFQASVSGLPNHFPPPHALDERQGNLPVHPNPLLGREDEIRALQAMLGRHDLRLITLTGPGGAGKTRLALEAASLMPLEFTSGATFVPLALVSNPQSVGDAVARALDLTAPNADFAAVIEYLRERQTLLVLDNFEHVLSAAPTVSDLLARCPDVKVLATSRERLNVRGEIEFSVTPLGLPVSPLAPVGDVAKSPAVQLFVERASAVRPGFKLESENAAAVAEICGKCDGLPLAIELVAARSRLLSPESLLARITGPLDIATHGPRDLPERQQSLRGAIGWSYNLLPPEQQQVFRELSVFRGGFTLEAAEAVLSPDVAAGFDAIEALAAKHLLGTIYTDAEARFGMLQAPREFGLEQLAELGESDGARSRHLKWVKEWISISAVRDSQEAHVRKVDSEVGNLREALEWASRSPEEAMAGLSAANAAGTFWWQRGPEEGAYWIERLLEAAQSVSPSLRSRSLYWVAFLRMQTRLPEDIPALVAVAEEAVREAEKEGGRPRELILGHNILGQVLVHVGDLERAGEECGIAVEAARALGDRTLIAMTLYPLGLCAFEREDINEARAAWDESCEIFRQSGNELLLATPLYMLANLALSQGELENAETLVAEGVRTLRRTGDTPRTPEVLALLTRVKLARGETRAAAHALREALDVVQTGFVPQTAPVLVAAAGVLAATGRWRSVVSVMAAASRFDRGPGARLVDRHDIERAMTQAQLQLSVDEFHEATRRGAAMSRTDAFALAQEAIDAG